MLLSVIVPCFNEEENVAAFYKELMKNRPFFEKEGLQTEILYINDGSADNTAAEVKRLHERDRFVHLVSFSRNFGKEAAIYAGLQKAKGDFVAIMDADLQDPPSLLPEMFSYLKQGYDSVATRRATRKGEPVIRSFFARLFYRIMNRISKTEIVDGARDYRLMTRQVVDSILKLCEYNRFTKGIYGWVGYETKWISYENVERANGKTKFNFWRLFLYSLDGIMAFSTVPLAISSVMGVLFCLAAFLAILALIIKNLLYHDPVAGWPSMVCIILLVSGVQLFSVGILGQYLAKTYLEVKRRPIYLIKEEL